MRKYVGRLISLLLGLIVLQAANGILGVMVPLQMGLSAVPTSLIGLVVTAYALGFLIGCAAAPDFIRPIGHIRAFAALAATLSIVSLIFIATDSPIVWMVLRFATGLCFAGLHAVIESWIATAAPVESRGRILSVYMICNKTALMVGQGSLALSEATGAFFFLVVCGCFSLSLIPVALTRVDAPVMQGRTTMGLPALFRMVPVAVVGCVGAGLANTAVLGLAPIFGLKSGLSAKEVPLLIVVAQLGSLAAQWPLGWLSDRIDRRIVIAAAAAISAVVALAAAVLARTDILSLLLLFAIWGGFSLSTYSICIAHAVDNVDTNLVVPVISTLLLSWAVGSTLGPPIAAGLAATVGAAGIFYFAAGVGLFVAVFSAWRTQRRPSIPVELKEEFVNLPASSPVVGELNPSGPAGQTPPGTPIDATRQRAAAPDGDVDLSAKHNG